MERHDPGRHRPQDVLDPTGLCPRFQALDDTHFLYKTTAYYNPESEGAILWSDPQLAISWPLIEPMVNEKDRAASEMKW